MTVLEVIQRGTDYLLQKGVESPRLQVELLLAHVLQVPRLKLYLNFDRNLSTEEENDLRLMVKRRGQREPLQHILGTVSFCGLELRVTPDVLVPRPETELLAERAWACAQALVASGVTPSVLDYGTGSGCLAVAIAHHCPTALVAAVDVSATALSIAAENAARHGLEARIHFHCSDNLAAVAGQKFNLIVSNPPYIPSSEIGRLMPEVRDYDPALALDGGPDGLEFYRRLALELPDLAAAGATVMLEIGADQSELVTNIWRNAGWLVDPPLRDYSGRDRILIAQRRI